MTVMLSAAIMQLQHFALLEEKKSHGDLVQHNREYKHDMKGRRRLRFVFAQGIVHPGS